MKVAAAHGWSRLESREELILLCVAGQLKRPTDDIFLFKRWRFVSFSFEEEKYHVASPTSKRASEGGRLEGYK